MGAGRFRAGGGGMKNALMRISEQFARGLVSLSMTLFLLILFNLYQVYNIKNIILSVHKSFFYIHKFFHKSSFLYAIL